MIVLRWSCTLYDGLTWLEGYPLVIVGALNLGMWVYIEGDCRRFLFICIYIYMLVLRWSCTLYDGLMWLGGSLMIMGSLDLGVWVCIQGDYRRCIFMLHCVHDCRNVIASIHVS